EVEFRAPHHRLAEHKRAKPAGRRGRDRSGEEDPHVAARSRTASLQRRRHPMLLARLEQRERIELPRLAIQVTGEEPTRVVLEQRVDTDRLPPAQMPLDR